MNIDPAIRFDLLQTALLCGGLFAAYRVILTVVYPLLSGAIWQHFVGQAAEDRWPGVAQSEHQGRPSYMPLDANQPYVMAWGLLPPPLDDLTHGIRDGLLLGVLVALVPEAMTSGLLTLLLAVVLCKSVWRISKQRGSDRTDQVFWAGKEVLIYPEEVDSNNLVGTLTPVDIQALREATDVAILVI